MDTLINMHLVPLRLDHHPLVPPTKILLSNGLTTTIKSNKCKRNNEHISNSKQRMLQRLKAKLILFNRNLRQLPYLPLLRNSALQRDSSAHTQLEWQRR
jgi:hypothetical protein